MITNENYKNFLQDIISLLKDELEKTKAEDSSADAFNSGMNFSLYKTLDLVKSQAAAFGIPLGEIGLEGYASEDYLITKSSLFREGSK